MADLKDSVLALNFVSNWGKNTTETAYCLKWLVDSRQCGEHLFSFAYLLSKFRSSLTSVKATDHSGHPLTSKTGENVDKVKDVVLENRRITIYEVANILGISVGSAHTSLKDSQNMHHIAMKFVSCTCSLSFFCMRISGYK
jgi:hypothetical protein